MVQKLWLWKFRTGSVVAPSLKAALLLMGAELSFRIPKGGILKIERKPLSRA